MGSRREAFTSGHMPKNRPMLTAITNPMNTAQTGSESGVQK